jgi:protease IV
VRLPNWFAQLPALTPELQLLRNAKAGTPNIYADCLCSPR